MAKLTKRAIFDATSLWVDIGPRALADGETAQSVTADQIVPGAVVGNGHWDAATSMIKAGFPLPARSARQSALWACHEQLNILERGLWRYSGGVKPAIRNRALLYLFEAREALYLVGTNTATATAGGAALRIVDAVCVKWAEELGSAPSGANVDDPWPFYVAVKGVAGDPAGPIAWVRLPTDGSAPQRVALGSAERVYGVVPDGVDHVGAGWIEGIASVT